MALVLQAVTVSVLPPPPPPPASLSKPTGINFHHLFVISRRIFVPLIHSVDDNTDECFYPAHA